MADPHFRPYEVVPGGPIWLEIETEDGRHFDVVAWVEKIPIVAGRSRVMHAKFTKARFTPPLPAP